LEGVDLEVTFLGMCEIKCAGERALNAHPSSLNGLDN